jgi:hypothetical protein
MSLMIEFVIFGKINSWTNNLWIWNNLLYLIHIYVKSLALDVR